LQQEAAKNCLAAAKAYENEKFNDRGTQEKCAREGITLVPVVAETFGGWGPVATNFFRRLLHLAAERQGQSVSSLSAQLYQGLAVRLQRANARAVLRRIADATSVTAPATFSSEAALVAAAADAEMLD
jgi:hypothetical protein